MESYSFYPTKTVDLFGKTIEIEPYRVVEIPGYITPIEEIKSKAIKLQFKKQKETKKRTKTGTKTGKKKDTEEDNKISDLSEEEFDLFMLLRQDETVIEDELFELVDKVSQLGLKRALYPDAKGLVGKELDKFPHVNTTRPKIFEVFRAMDELAQRELQDMPVDDTKNEKTSTPESSSKTLKP